VTISPFSLEIPAGGTVQLLVALRLSGSAPNGTAFGASFVPSETRSTGLRSGAADRVTQPSSPIASPVVIATVLAAGQAFSMSENPVRSQSVTFNFPERPSVAGIYTVKGERVMDLLARLDSDNTVQWDLRNDHGTTVSPGVYLIVFVVGGETVRERLIVLRGSGFEPEPETHPGR
jgi:hypothetical protein